MTLQDIQVPSVTPAQSRTASQRTKGVLRSWFASYLARYEPTTGSTTVDASSQLNRMPVR